MWHRLRILPDGVFERTNALTKPKRVVSRKFKTSQDAFPAAYGGVRCCGTRSGDLAISRKNVLVHIAITYGLALYLLFAIPFPTLVPTDLEALELLVLGAVPLAAYFLIGLLVEEWLKDRIEHYWFWRITATTIFISVGAGLIYGMFVMAPVWLPHFR